MLQELRKRTIVRVVGRYGLIALLTILLLIMIHQNRRLMRISVNRNPSDELRLQIGQEAPHFALPTVAGNRVELIDYWDQGVLLIFFGPSCQACRSDTALWRVIDQRAAQREIPVLGIAYGDVDEIKAFAEEEEGLQFPILLDENHRVMQDYFVYGTPCKILLDRELRVAHIWAGVTTSHSSSEDLYELKRYLGILPSQLPSLEESS